MKTDWNWLCEKLEGYIAFGMSVCLSVSLRSPLLKCLMTVCPSSHLL